MPPELIAQPGVTWAGWSSDGRYALVQREALRTVPLAPPTGPEPLGETSLVLWNRRTGRSQEVWRRPVPAYSLDRVEWLPGAAVALAVVHWVDGPGDHPEPHRGLLRVDATGSPARAIAELDPADQLEVSPTQPVAVLHRQKEIPDPAAANGGTMTRSELRVLKADAGAAPAIMLPERLAVGATHWSADGRLFCLQGIRIPPGGPQRGQKLVAEWFTFDPRSGRVTRVEKRPEPYTAPPPRWPYRLKGSPTTLKEADTVQRVRPLWVESVVPSSHPRALVCADSRWAMPSPDGGALLYVAEGGAWVTPLEKRPKEQVQAAVDAAQQAVAMSNAKQLGVALMMYAQDYDETLPPADGMIKDTLLPYLKNPSLFQDPATGNDAFVYTYAGGKLSGIQDPSTTQLGYLAGGAGRAIIYADGHVKWEKP
jgi:hypothetical protein